MGLSKVLQQKLNIFLDSKAEKLSLLKNQLGIIDFNYSKNEIDTIQNLYENNFDVSLREYIYIGEAIIYNARGEWSICNLKRDEAYGLPIILHYGNKEKDHDRISPLLGVVCRK